MIEFKKIAQEEIKGYDIASFEIPQNYCGYANENIILHKNILASLQEHLRIGSEKIYVKTYDKNEIDYSMHNFLLIYIYTLYLFSIENRSSQIVFLCPNQDVLIMYESILISLIQNKDLYKKGIDVLFEKKEIEVELPVTAFQAFMIRKMKNEKYKELLINMEGEKIAKKIEMSNNVKIPVVYHDYESQDFSPVLGGVNIIGSKSLVSFINSKRVKIKFAYICG